MAVKILAPFHCYEPHAVDSKGEQTGPDRRVTFEKNQIVETAPAGASFEDWIEKGLAEEV